MSAGGRLLPDRRAVLAGGGAVLLGAAAPLPDFAALERRLEGGRLGVHAANGKAGLSYRASERFPMCSTFKTLLAAHVLARVDAGQERLDRMIAYGPADMVPHAPVTGAHLAEGQLSVEALCAAIIQLSDNPAANILMKTLGGPAGLTAWLRTVGDDVSRLDRWETELNSSIPGDPRDTTTPAAMTRICTTLLQGDVLTPASRARLAGWLEGTTTGARRLRANLPEGWRAGDKTGTGDNGSTNDVAVFWPPSGGMIVAAAYVTATKVPMAVREEVLAEVGRLVREGLA